MKKKNALIVATAIMLMVVGVAAVVLYHFHFRQRLVLTTPAEIKVYTDPSCAPEYEFKQGDTLDWGEHSTTDDLQKTLYIKNTGTGAVTLRFGWSGDHPWIGMSWDYNETPVAEDEVRPVTITLDLPDHDVGAGEMWWDGWFEAVPA